jgi:hypothetical protein
MHFFNVKKFPFNLMLQIYNWKAISPILNDQGHHKCRPVHINIKSENKIRRSRRPATKTVPRWTRRRSRCPATKTIPKWTRRRSRLTNDFGFRKLGKTAKVKTFLGPNWKIVNAGLLFFPRLSAREAVENSGHKIVFFFWPEIDEFKNSGKNVSCLLHLHADSVEEGWEKLP